MTNPLLIAAIAIFGLLGGRRLALSHLGRAEYAPHVITSEILRQDRAMKQARKVEHLLCQVRQTQTPIKDNSLRPEWQLMALDGTNFEFALMLVTVVWGEQGQEFAEHRLERFKASPMYFDLRKLSINKPLHATHTA